MSKLDPRYGAVLHDYHLPSRTSSPAPLTTLCANADVSRQTTPVRLFPTIRLSFSALSPQRAILTPLFPTWPRPRFQSFSSPCPFEFPYPEDGSPDLVQPRILPRRDTLTAFLRLRPRAARILNSLCRSIVDVYLVRGVPKSTALELEPHSGLDFARAACSAERPSKKGGRHNAAGSSAVGHVECVGDIPEDANL